MAYRAAPQRPAPPPGGGAQVHHLFVIVGGSPDAQAGTIRVLQFLAHCKPVLMRIGVVMEVHKIRPEMLRDPRLVAALQAKGIVEFPAVKTPRKLFAGVTNIARAYTVVIEDYKRMLKAQGEEADRTASAVGRRGLNVPGGASADDIYRDYYASELSFSAAETDHGDEGMGGGGESGMMDKVRTMMKHRQMIDDQRAKKSGAYIHEDAAVASHRQNPSDPAAPGVGDNVADEHLIDRLIATTTAPVTQETLDKAFQSDGGSEDAREDLMLHAFWENQKESI